MSDAVYVFRLYTESQQRALSTAFESLARQWSQDWFVGAPQIKIGIDQGDSLSGSGNSSTEEFIAYEGEKSACVLIERSTQALKLLESAVSGEAPSAVRQRQGLSVTPVVRSVLERAMAAFASQVLGQSSHVMDDAGANSVWTSAKSAGSGAVLLTISLGQGALKAVVSAAAVSRLLKQSPVVRTSEKKMASMDSALARQRVGARLLIGQGEIALKELSTLSVGDTIAFDQDAGTDFVLTTLSGEKIAKAGVAAHGDRLSAVIIGKCDV